MSCSFSDTKSLDHRKKYFHNVFSILNRNKGRLEGLTELMPKGFKVLSSCINFCSLTEKKRERDRRMETKWWRGRGGGKKK